METQPKLFKNRALQKNNSLPIDGGGREWYVNAMNTRVYENIATPRTTWNAAAKGAVELVSEQGPVPSLVISEIRMMFKHVEDLVVDNSYLTALDESSDELIMAWARTGYTAYSYARSSGHGFTWDELIDTLVRKQRDYGHDNIARFGAFGLAVRCHDKIARLENLVTRGLEPGNESIKDNLLDVAGYCAIGIMWAAETFLLELE